MVKRNTWVAILIVILTATTFWNCSDESSEGASSTAASSSEEYPRNIKLTLDGIAQAKMVPVVETADNLWRIKAELDSAKAKGNVTTLSIVEGELPAPVVDWKFIGNSLIPGSPPADLTIQPSESAPAEEEEQQEESPSESEAPAEDEEGESGEEEESTGNEQQQGNTENQTGEQGGGFSLSSLKRFVKPILLGIAAIIGLLVLFFGIRAIVRKVKGGKNKVELPQDQKVFGNDQWLPDMKKLYKSDEYKALPKEARKPLKAKYLKQVKLYNDTKKAAKKAENKAKRKAFRMKWFNYSKFMLYFGILAGVFILASFDATWMMLNVVLLFWRMKIVRGKVADEELDNRKARKDLSGAFKSFWFILIFGTSIAFWLIFNLPGGWK